jgi:hypothetical protein
MNLYKLITKVPTCICPFSFELKLEFVDGLRLRNLDQSHNKKYLDFNPNLLILFQKDQQL